MLILFILVSLLIIKDISVINPIKIIKKQEIEENNTEEDIIDTTWEIKKEMEDGKLEILVQFKYNKGIEYLFNKEQKIKVNNKTQIGVDIIANKNSKYPFKVKFTGKEEEEYILDTSKIIEYQSDSIGYPIICASGVSKGKNVKLINYDNVDNYYYSMNNEENWNQFDVNNEILIINSIKIKRKLSNNKEISPIININSSDIVLADDALEEKAYNNLSDYVGFKSDASKYMYINSDMQGKNFKIYYEDVNHGGNNKLQIHIYFYDNNDQDLEMTEGPLRNNYKSEGRLITIPEDAVKMKFRISRYSTGWSNNTPEMRIYNIEPVL